MQLAHHVHLDGSAHLKLDFSRFLTRQLASLAGLVKIQPLLRVVEADSENSGATANGPKRFFFVVAILFGVFQEEEVISQELKVSPEDFLVLLDSLEFEPVVQHLIQVHSILGLRTHLLFFRPLFMLLAASARAVFILHNQ